MPRKPKNAPPVDFDTFAAETAPGGAFEPVLPADTPILPPAAPPALPTAGTVELVHIKALFASPLNPRKTFPQPELEELADSIADNGLLQPLTARPYAVEEIPNAREVYIGGRRLRALEMLFEQGRWPKEKLPGHLVPVTLRPADDLEVLKIAGAENINRQDMHPLEEGDLFVELRRRGYSTEQIAQAYGKTKRWVEQRIQVTSGLDPKTRDLFSAGTINMEAARELVRVPEKARAVHVAAIAKGDERYKTAADLRNRIAEGLPEASKALFDLALYDGEYEMGGVYTKTRRCSDAEQFHRLQAEAIEAKRQALEQEWAWVKVIRVKHSYFYAQDHGLDRMYQRAKKAVHGAVIAILPDASVEIVEGVCEGTAPPAPTKADAKAAGDPIAAIGTGRREHAHKVKSMALQTAILRGGHRAALEMAVMALFGEGKIAKIRTEHVTFDGRVVAPEVLDRLRAWSERLGGKAFDTLDPSDRKANYALEFRTGYDIDKTPRAGVFGALARLSDADLADLFDVLVAARCGSWPSYGSDGPSLGNEAFTIAAAERYGVDMAATPVIDRDYLDKLQRDDLHLLAGRINGWCLDHGGFPCFALAELQQMKVPEMRAFIAQQVATIGVRLVPPELTFATTTAIENALRAPMTASKAKAEKPRQIDLEEAIETAKGNAPAESPKPPACILSGFDRLTKDLVEDLSQALPKHPHYGRMLLRLVHHDGLGRSLSLMKASDSPVTYEGMRYDDGFATHPLDLCDDMSLARFVLDFRDAPERFVDLEEEFSAAQSVATDTPIAFVRVYDSLIEQEYLDILAEVLPSLPNFGDELLQLRVAGTAEVLTLEVEDPEDDPHTYKITRFDDGAGNIATSAGFDDDLVKDFIDRWIADQAGAGALDRPVAA